MKSESRWLYYLRGAQAIGLIAVVIGALALIHAALIIAGFKYLAGVELSPGSLGVWIGALILVGLTTRIAWWGLGRLSAENRYAHEEREE
ncbi:hypothetical protein [Thioalkalivibrio sp. ALMg11]|uniref:hypothetical protein n=1 Tax=Thioalkalivibrio sp. ALMg11 TaxID=1158165 RepID=UPI000381C273|nr:hypothetical protein [Thioalkalivibrio sp. ALMg11]